VFVLDANNQCGRPEEWDYYLHTYFPTGLTFANHPGTARRVWHVVSHVTPNAAQQREVAAGRISQQFIGPPGCQFRLYEAPPRPHRRLI
ncbi:MAG TPA: hypothetical protein VHO69_05815, partial [Phototrophicaceae bacterium]|nr:hypothetical protein [Phototrophicaceae bacterium]